MTPQKFEILLDKRIESLRTTLSSKAKEYATEDRFHNFKVAAQINNETPQKALWGMATKHLVSVMDIVKGNVKYDHAMIDEKLGDLFAYIVLLEGVLKEDV